MIFFLVKILPCSYLHCRGISLSKRRLNHFSFQYGIILPTVEPGHTQVQKHCGEDPGESFQDSQGSLTHGLQEGVKGVGLVQSGKKKAKGNLIAYYIYLEVVTRITEPHNRSKEGATGRSCALEGLYQEIPGEGWCSLEKVTGEVEDLHPWSPSRLRKTKSQPAWPSAGNTPVSSWMD